MSRFQEFVEHTFILGFRTARDKSAPIATTEVKATSAAEARRGWRSNPLSEGNVLVAIQLKR